MGDKKSNCITLNQNQTETRPEKKWITYILQFVILNINQMSGFTLNMEKRHSELVLKINYAVSPKVSLLMINVTLCHSSAIHQSAYPIKLSSLKDMAHFQSRKVPEWIHGNLWPNSSWNKDDLCVFVRQERALGKYDRHQNPISWKILSSISSLGERLNCRTNPFFPGSAIHHANWLIDRRRCINVD